MIVNISENLSMIELARTYLKASDTASWNTLKKAGSEFFLDHVLCGQMIFGENLPDGLPEIDLSDCSLDGLKANQLNLRGANLRNITVSQGTVFYECDLSHTDLTGAWLGKLDCLQTNVLEAAKGIIYIPNTYWQHDICQGIFLSDHSNDRYSAPAVYLKPIWSYSTTYTNRMQNWIDLNKTNIENKGGWVWDRLDEEIQAILLPMTVSGLHQACAAYEHDKTTWTQAPKALGMLAGQWGKTYPKVFAQPRL